MYEIEKKFKNVCCLTCKGIIYLEAKGQLQVPCLKKKDRSLEALAF
jgi:hypothetical protein